MGILGTFVKSAFLALALAAYQLFFQGLWNKWIELQGKSVGFGETALGYFIVISIAWILAAIVTRALGGAHSE
jgi:hypothetical protein